MEILKEEIIQVLRRVMMRLNIQDEKWVELLQEPRMNKDGDLCLPCFTLSKELRKAPHTIAKEVGELLKDEILSQNESVIGSVVTENGYLNIFANIEWLISERISPILDSPDTAGFGLPTKKRILIEHTSANPNGPFHVGRTRNAIIGDALVRLHRIHGDEVTAEYYVDDMGKQVGILAWALANLNEEFVDQVLSEGDFDYDLKFPTKQDHLYVRYYQAANILSKNQENDVTEGKHRELIGNDSISEQVAELVLKSEDGDSEALNSFEAAYMPVLDGMLETLSRLGIEYDIFTRESKFVLDGSVADVMDKLGASPLCGIAENGARYLELEDKGVSGKSTKFFFQRGDGSSLYASRDVAYHRWKWGQADRLINVLGEDHRLQSKQVSIALEELGIESPHVVFYAFVKMPEGKMSTRLGNVVFVDDLIDEGVSRALSLLKERRPDIEDEIARGISEAVATSSIRFNILKVSPEKGFAFRWEDALSFEADSAPFIMYSHARACSISSKLENYGFSTDSLLSEYSMTKVGDLNESSEKLIRVMSRFQDAIERSVELGKPNNFCTYILELASTYNSFYRDCPVISKGDVNLQNLALNECCKMLLKTACNALGIVALDSM